MCRNNEQSKGQVMGKTLSRGTNSLLPFDVNVMLNLSNMTIDLSINGYSHSNKTIQTKEKHFEKREKNWLVQRLGLWGPQGFDMIQAGPFFLHLNHSRRQKEALLARCAYPLINK